MYQARVELRENINTLLQHTNNEDIKRMIEEEGMVKVSNTMVSGIMEVLDGLTITSDAGDYASGLARIFSREKFGKFLNNRSKLAKSGSDYTQITKSIAQRDTISENGIVRNTGQVFV